MVGFSNTFSEERHMATVAARGLVKNLLDVPWLQTARLYLLLLVEPARNVDAFGRVDKAVMYIATTKVGLLVRVDGDIGCVFDTPYYRRLAVAR
jgi:hypothetical protein